MSRPAALLAEDAKAEQALQASARVAYALSQQEHVSEPQSEPKDRTPPWPTLGEAAYYGLVGRFVRLIEKETEADPVAVMLQFLALFGNIVGRSAYFLVEGARHYANIFVLIVGITSKGRKGTALNHCLNVFQRVDESYVLRCLCSGTSSGEGVIAGVRDPTEEKQPIKEKGKVVGYQTVITDSGVEDKRLVAVETEFASPVARMGRDGNTLSAVIRQSFDTGNLRVMTRNNPVRATGAHISILAHITNDELRRVLDRTELANGFMNRFAIALSRRSKLLPLGGNVSAASLNDVVSETRKAVDTAWTFSEVRFNDEATALWCERYEMLSASRAGMLGAVTSRSEAYVIRLSLIYALMDCSDVIRREHLEAGLVLWQYCEDSARFIFGDALGDKLADEILLALRDAADIGMTRSQISQLFKRNVDADRLNAALSCLAQNGLAQSRKEHGEGRPVERWFATEREPSVPAVPDTEEIVFEAPISD